MSYRIIFKVLGSYLLLYALILLIPLALSIYYQFYVEAMEHPQPHATEAFLWTIAVCIGLALFCLCLSHQAKGILYRREALVSSVLIWVATPAIGALPFLFSGTLERFDQAYLESTSGFTTTGSSVMEAKKFDADGKEILIEKTYCGLRQNTYDFYGNINPVYDEFSGKTLEGLEAVSRAILFWRNFTEWLGGMGIIILFVAFLPALGSGGKFLFQTETPGIEKEGFAPRIKETAIKIWKIYASITILIIFLLMITNGKMQALDAISIAFSTISTGGLTIHADSIAYYQNSYTEWIVCIFMIAAGINFSLYHYVFKGKIYRLFEPEFILYILLIVIFGFFAAWNLTGQPHIGFNGENLGIYTPVKAIRDGFFQLISTMTTTGFFTANYDTWPMALQALMLLTMFMGAMSGSTSGGVKLIRIYMLIKIAQKKIESIFKPKEVRILKVGQREIDSSTALTVLCFFFISIAFSTLGAFIYVLDNIDSETAFSLSVAMINTTGLGFRLNGPSGSLAFLSPWVSYFTSFLMILGRLEFFAVLVLLFPSFWKDSSFR